MKAEKYDKVIKAVDKIVRDEMIRREYELLIKNKIQSTEAIKILSQKPYENVDGKKYFIGEKMIQEIIYQPKRRTK